MVDTINTQALVDNGCLVYATISEKLVRKLGLPRIPIIPRKLRGFNSSKLGFTDSVVYAPIDIDGHRQHRVFFYVIPNQTYDIILGLPWMESEGVVISPAKKRLWISSSNSRVWNRSTKPLPSTIAALEISATSMSTYIRKQRKDSSIQLFAASLKDIEKALRPKPKGDPKKLLPPQYQEFLSVFGRSKAEQLPPRRPGVDHAIVLEKDEKGREKQPPWGPLYPMSREELLVLRKTLLEYLDKGFIRASSSPAAAPILFAKKPGGGLRFCVDYRGLNAITIKDRYPLPLIKETLRRLSTARWFTKLDIISAFHEIRIREGDEWKTAFRTRFGLFEWLVCPFGLTSGPSTFQRYINHTLREYLDLFCSAYIDDILIFSSGSLKDHQDKVRKVLRKLQEAGLQVDIDKCAFETTEVKYLGFIIRAGEGIQMDPEKVRAIEEWEPPKSIKGVRGFLGFANYYREFIPSFSDITIPLTALTRKDTPIPFRLTPEALQAFEKLKSYFTTSWILAHFDPSLETVLEVDSSGFAVGGCLSQYDQEGRLRPCGFFSKRCSPAERNYTIHDRELLAIIRGLEEYDAELRSLLEPFSILTDHDSLRYFMKVQRLNDRQIRWAERLDQYNYRLVFRPGKDNIVADSLSRREQDQGLYQDKELSERLRQLLSRQVLKETIQLASLTSSTSPFSLPSPFEDSTWTSFWNIAIQEDQDYQIALQAIQEGEKSWPRSLRLQVSISECDLDFLGRLRFRERLWIPSYEPLRTSIIQKVHDSSLSGHPGHEVTYSLISRRFFWPGCSSDTRRFVRNCTTCGRTAIWREKKRGLLKPLPIPSRLWREISMDFITDLPESEGYTNLLVITDRLSKGVILIPIGEMTAENTAITFLRHFCPHHGLPSAIVSDRGTQFVNALWKRICELLKIIRRLSTAWHPETDGSTERMNQFLETYLRAYTSIAQDNWVGLLPAAAMAINSRPSSSTQVSPFFLQHGYELETLPESLNELQETSRVSPIAIGEEIVRKLKEGSEWAQACIAIAQERQERYANQGRQPADSFEVKDKVWLSLRNIQTTRPSKKLDWKNGLYTVLEKVGSHSYRLNTPRGIHNVFHTSLLRRASQDPFPSQQLQDPQPDPILPEDSEDEEWAIEEILCVSGTRTRRKALVKWVGWPSPTWEPLSALQDTIALDTFEATYGPAETNDGPLYRYQRRKRRGGG